MRWDDEAFYPEVLRNDAAGLYDLALAAVAKVVALFGVEPMRALWWVCLWFPPLCTAAILPFVYLLVRRHGTIAIGLVMALWYVLLPGLTLSHMTLGIPDHHVVEMIFGVLCILLLQRLVERERQQATPWWRPAWGTALPLALFQFTWLGAPLFLVIFGLAFLGQLAADILAGVGARPLVNAGVRFWLAFLILTAGTGVIFPDVVFLPYLWEATLVGTVCLLGGLAVAGWYFETARVPFRPGIRLALLAGIMGVMAVLLLSASPALQMYLWTGLGPKSHFVAENQVVTGRFYFGVTGLAGILGLLAPLAGIAFGAWTRPGWWLGVLPSVAFIGLWYRTYDYGYQGALHAILLTGYLLGAVAAWLPAGSGRARRFVLRPALAVATLAVVLCRWPAQWTAPLWLPGDWYDNGSGMPSDGWIEAMRWLRIATPAPPAPAAQPVPGLPPRGRVGVLTDWCDGQFVNSLAGRPATASRFPVANGMAPFFLQDETAVRTTNLRGSPIAASVRYVALGPRTIGDIFHTHRELVGLKPEEFFGRANFLNASGQNIGVPTLGPAYDRAFATRLVRDDANGFSHFRLVFESRQQSFLRFTLVEAQGKGIMPLASVVRTEADRNFVANCLKAGLWEENGMRAYLGHLLATVKIFEQVEGARVEGRAPPRASVTVRIPLRLRTSGRAWQYTQSGRADEDGNFRLIVPYATVPATGTDVTIAGEAVVSLDDAPAGHGGTAEARQALLNIPESVVQNGERVTWRGWLGQEPSTAGGPAGPGG
jgi:asparagine N-glycosylation enzyme membrane subunit Stt3